MQSSLHSESNHVGSTVTRFVSYAIDSVDKSFRISDTDPKSGINVRVHTAGLIQSS